MPPRNSKKNKASSSSQDWAQEESEDSPLTATPPAAAATKATTSTKSPGKRSNSKKRASSGKGRGSQNTTPATAAPVAAEEDEEQEIIEGHVDEEEEEIVMNDNSNSKNNNNNSNMPVTPLPALPIAQLLVGAIHEGAAVSTLLDPLLTGYRDAIAAVEGNNSNSKKQQVAQAKQRADSRMKAICPLINVTLAMSGATGLTSSTLLAMLKLQREGSVPAGNPGLPVFGAVSEEMMRAHDGEVQTILEEVMAHSLRGQEAADAAPLSGSLLTGKDPKLRRLRKGFGELFSQLVISLHSLGLLLPRDTTTNKDNTNNNGGKNKSPRRHAEEEDGSDDLFLELLEWLKAMNESRARPLRYTAAVALFGIIDGLNEVGKTTQKAMEYAKKKDLPQLNHTLQTAWSVLDRVFHDSVHNRLKDVAPEIRLVALERLKQWLLSYPAYYLRNERLRYLRIGLYDRKSEARIEVLDTLAGLLFTVPEASEKLYAFLSHSIARIVAMCNDVDTHCAHAAIRLCKIIIREVDSKAKGAVAADLALFDGDGSSEQRDALLKPDHLDAIFAGMFDDRSIIRSDTGKLLSTFMSTQMRALNITRPRDNMLFALITSFLEETDGLTEEFVIDALWCPEDLPELLTDHKPFIEMTTSKESEDTGLGLRIIAALLRHLAAANATLQEAAAAATATEESQQQGGAAGAVATEVLGPFPKDDRAMVTTVSKEKREEVEAAIPRQYTALSKAIMEKLSTVLETCINNAKGAAAALLSKSSSKSKGASKNAATAAEEASAHLREVTVAVAKVFATVDLTAVSGKNVGLGKAITLFRQACTMASLTYADADDITAAWRRIAFAEYSGRAVGEGEFRALAKDTLDALLGTSNENDDDNNNDDNNKKSAKSPKKGKRAAAATSSSQKSQDDESQQLSEEQREQHWLRLYMLGSLLSLDDYFDFIVNALQSAVAAQNWTLQRIISAIAHYSVLWRVGASLENMNDTTTSSKKGRKGNNNDNAVADAVERLLGLLLDIGAGNSIPTPATPEVTADTAVLVEQMNMRCAVMGYAADLLCLPAVPTPGDPTVLQLLGVTEQLLQHTAAMSQATTDAMKEASHIAQAQAGASVVKVWVRFLQERAALNTMERSVCQAVGGIQRLFMLNKIGPEFAPLFLFLWTVTPFKSSSDLFKALFHALRDRLGGDGFSLERSVLAAGVDKVLMMPPGSDIAVPMSHLGNLATKLASLHMPLTDKHYEACRSMVAWALEPPSSLQQGEGEKEDPALRAHRAAVIFHGVAPYCVKLRRQDAQQALLSADMAARQKEFGEAHDGFNAFVAALRRSAKVAGGSNDGPKPGQKRGRPASASAAAATSASRGDGIAGSTTEMGGEGANAVDVDVAQAIGLTTTQRGGARSSPKRGRGKGSQHNNNNNTRVTTEDGWRVKANAAEDAETTLVATQEWE